MTHTPQPTPIETHEAESATDLELVSSVAEIQEEAKEFNSTQVRELFIKPFFDRIDAAIARGDIKDKETGEPYTATFMREQFKGLWEDFTLPHSETQHAEDPLQSIPRSNGLRTAIDELLLDSLTDGPTMREIEERYVTDTQSDGSSESMEKLRQGMSGEPSAEEAVALDKELREAEIQEQIETVMGEMNGLVNTLSIMDQKWVDAYAAAALAGDEVKRVNAWHQMTPKAQQPEVYHEYTERKRKLNELQAQRKAL